MQERINISQEEMDKVIHFKALAMGLIVTPETLIEVLEHTDIPFQEFVELTHSEQMQIVTDAKAELRR